MSKVTYEWKYDTSGKEALDEVRARRGFTLPVHEVMASVDPEILRAYNALAGNLIFGPEPRHLDLKTRFLVLVGITTAVKGDREGVEWASRNAMKYGASEQEVLEAILLSGLPGGMPTVEAATIAFAEMLQGKGWVEQGSDEEPATAAEADA
ncbi:carboxymuconolactone decarboxylase family protein [Nocardioides sp. LHD-245]|uniref:carboxymuconolactone decarboxylase family protein n=1 Tax=Nocardioides sp. LHD-245 TaxID=3051387 RepID=UPI0027E14AFB|nr:carboxymuconolactone decarboxylase family protein [Nocardioides sp. LHD-245]